MMPIKNRRQCLRCGHLFIVNELKAALKMTKCPKCKSDMTMKAEGCVIVPVRNEACKEGATDE